MATKPLKTALVVADASAIESAIGAMPDFTVPPVLGSQIEVRVADGGALINNETGQPFTAGEATPQTVTVTTLSRLRDGDLVRVS